MDLAGRCDAATQELEDKHMTSARDLENRFLGALLGLAIGDALGMPVSDMPVAETRERFGQITDYLARDEGDYNHIPSCEIN